MIVVDVHSTQRIAIRAKAHRRRMYARLRGSDGSRMRARDLDLLTMELIRNYAEAVARRELLPADSPASWTAQNSTTRALLALERRLRQAGLVTDGKQGSSLESYLASRPRGGVNGG